MKPERGWFDLAVIGGGSAGLAAAITAARSGARVIVIERHGFLGGMGTASLVHTFCGLYLLRMEPNAVFANPGFATEMATRMIAATGIGPQRMGRVDVLLQHPVEFVKIADELVAAEHTLELMLHTEVCGVSQTGPGWKICISGRAGEECIRARTLIDASGDAAVSEFLSSASEMTASAKLQRPAYIFGVRTTAVMTDDLRLHTAGLIVEGVRRGELSVDAMGMTFRASGRAGEVFGSIDLSGCEESFDFDPLDRHCLTQIELRGRMLATSVMRWLTFRSDSWKTAYISHWPVRAGIRESRRWVGEYVLTGDDLLEGRRFDDEIALATWPMEFREDAKGPKWRYPKENRPAGIPIGCLRPIGIQNLWVAGRCISTDHDAQASIRVMGTCFATGEAAGRAAYQSL
jgi:hypothetical protein